MTEDMILEDLPWESDEDDFESDEAMAEAEDEAEDWGEARRRRRPSRPRSRSRYRPQRGIRGMRTRTPDGRARTTRFPSKLATAADTNRGLAHQEVGRRAVEDRVNKLEGRMQAQRKKDSNASGLVSLILSGGLTTVGAFDASRKAEGTRLGAWASSTTTEMAAVTAVGQLARSGANLIINGKYHRSGVGISADIFSALQLAAFAYASFYKKEVFKIVADVAALKLALAGAAVGAVYLVADTGQKFRAAEDPDTKAKHFLKM